MQHSMVVIPPDVKVKLNTYQKVYLSTCLEVPFEALDVYVNLAWTELCISYS